MKGKVSQVTYRTPDQHEECEYLIRQIKAILGHGPRSRKLYNADVIERALYYYVDYLEREVE